MTVSEERKQALENQVVALNELDKYKDQVLKEACQTLNSAECGAARADLDKAYQTYFETLKPEDRMAYNDAYATYTKYYDGHKKISELAFGLDVENVKADREKLAQRLSEELGVDKSTADKLVLGMHLTHDLMSVAAAVVGPNIFKETTGKGTNVNAGKGTTTKGSIIDGASDAASTAKIKIEYKPEGTYINQTSHLSGGSNLCGPTTCTMAIIDKKGNVVNLDSVVKQFDNIRPSGVNINEMSSVLSKNGVSNTPTTTITTNQLKDLGTKNQSTIIGVSAGNQGHFIIVDSYKKVDGVGYYMICDPYNGAMGVRADLLYSKMNGNGVILK